jgi:two-component system chemotaxis sensor kinase CheA
MNEVVREFLLEMHDNLAQLDLDLVRLEKEPSDRDTLSRVFRTLHTVKGTSGFLGLPKLQAVAHAAENLLSKLRSGELSYNTEIASALLGSVDAIRKLLDSLEKSEGKAEGPANFITLIQTLERLTGGTAHPSRSVTMVTQGPPTPPPEVSTAPTRLTQILQFSTSQEDDAFLGTVQRLNLLTTEIQAGVMKTRMQPIGNLWSKFPRIVRDLAVACGKQVRLEMDGQETELDKTIVESIRDPLTHLVRNAIDHGIETPERRAAAGKPPEGRLRLHAAHEGGKVIIEMSDDGGGIDPERVRHKAVASQLVPADNAARLGERELLDLIFLPGFSTTDRVTQFSGRGVGMDVVRTNIE